MNDIVKSEKSGGALAAVAALKGNLRKAKQQIPETQGLQYLRFLQDGSWVFGQENEEVLTEDRVAINPLSLKTGWSCWTDRPGKGAKNENMGESMVALGQDPIMKADLPKHRDPKNDDALCEWKEQISVDVKFLSGPHKGKQVHYKTTSVGGINAMSALIDQIMLQLDEDPEHVVPVVNLDGEHYQHKSYGRTYTPKIKIVDWVSMDGDAMTEEEPEEEEEDEVEEKPKPKKKKAAKKRKPEPEPEPEEEEEDEGEEEQEEDQEEEQEEEEQPRRRRRR